MPQVKSPLPYRLYNEDCFQTFARIPSASVDMVLCDLPYGEVTQKSSGLRLLDRGSVDTCNIDLKNLVDEFNRVCTGTMYAFCGTEQISPLIGYFKGYGMTTRLCAWDKTNPSPMNGEHLWISGMEFCVFARKPSAIFNEYCKKALWQAPSGQSKIHPTEKPFRLMKRLILASSNHGDTVLDCCMGSGTTGVAAMHLGRKFIGCDSDTENGYFETAELRIKTAWRQAQQK